MKTFITFLAACLIFTGKASAQLYEIAEVQKESNSTLIVEGTVVSQYSFWNEQRTMIYTSNKIKLHKVFKGEMNEGFIEVLTQGGTVGYDNITASDLLELSVGESGVFFCNPNILQLRAPQSGKVLWDVYSSAQGMIKYDLDNMKAGSPFSKYESIRDDLYPSLQAMTGRKAIIKDPQFSVEPKINNKPTAVDISGFSPSRVNAGATADPSTNILTINGSGFGLPNGTAAILFDDANNGTGGIAFEVLHNSNLVISWTDAQIVVRVPTRAGTGFFSVRDEFGSVDPSPSPLEVHYSILTASFSGIIKQSNLMNDDGIGGYTIFYSNSTAGGTADFNASPEKVTFQRALNTWQESVGFNVTEGGTTASQAISPSDGLNVIMFDNTNTGVLPLADGTLAVCYSYNGACNPVSTNEYQKTQFDIIVRRTGISDGNTVFAIGPCRPSTSIIEYDLETVLLHELGHALNLGHINDDYQGNSFPGLNPGKLMNYAIVYGVKRTSLDVSAYEGGLYTCTPHGRTYGSCGLPLGEMVQLPITVVPNDECPATFPASSTATNTVENFDLVHATSNKYVDPQYNGINCQPTAPANRTAITNTAFATFRTSASTTFDIAVMNYSVTPSSQQACTNAGVELAFYQVNSCPAGQAYPAPVTCRTFNADGTMQLTGLLPNTNYLVFADGRDNTKANFDLVFNFDALPITLAYFKGQVKPSFNQLTWMISSALNVSKVVLERKAGSGYTGISTYSSSEVVENIAYVYDDPDALPGENYYRLATYDLDGSVEYSDVVMLNRNVPAGFTIYPNPVEDNIELKANFSTAQRNVQVKVFNSLGQMMLNKKMNFEAGSSVTTLPAGNFTPGLYNIVIESEKGRIFSSRFRKL